MNVQCGPSIAFSNLPSFLKVVPTQRHRQFQYFFNGFQLAAGVGDTRSAEWRPRTLSRNRYRFLRRPSSADADHIRLQLKTVVLAMSSTLRSGNILRLPARRYEQAACRSKGLAHTRRAIAPTSVSQGRSRCCKRRHDLRINRRHVAAAKSILSNGSTAPLHANGFISCFRSPMIRGMEAVVFGLTFLR